MGERGVALIMAMAQLAVPTAGRGLALSIVAIAIRVPTGREVELALIITVIAIRAPTGRGVELAPTMAEVTAAVLTEKKGLLPTMLVVLPEVQPKERGLVAPRKAAFPALLLTGERNGALITTVALVVVLTKKKELYVEMVEDLVAVHMKEREPVLKMAMAPVQGIALMVVVQKALCEIAANLPQPRNDSVPTDKRRLLRRGKW